MSIEISSIPAPSEWVSNKLRELKVSNSALARIIGQDRTQVQRWVNGREQIPRHHLAEIAVQLGTHVDLDYALKLKECEDSTDSLKRRLRELARVGGFDLPAAESAVFTLLEKITSEEEHKDANEYASALMYNMAHASFIFRLWLEAAVTRDFTHILTPHNLKLHIQYPANHFLGLALSIERNRGLMPEYRLQCLDQLRRLATAQRDENPVQLSHKHHAIHVLGRFGSSEDRTTVSEFLLEAAASSEPISVRLGYAGLTLQPGNDGLAEKYLWLLQRNDILATIDIAFDTVHYGDAAVNSDQELPMVFTQVTRTIANLLRRLAQPEQYAAIRELDTYRLRTLLSRLAPTVEPDRSLIPKLTTALEQTLAVNRNQYTAEAEILVANLLHRLTIER